jgi:hypothetical protein
MKRKRRSPNATTYIPSTPFLHLRTNTLSRNAALEQKIESFVNLLSTAHGITPTSAQPTPPESQPRSEASPDSFHQPQENAAIKPTDLSWAAVSQSCRTAWQGAACELEPQRDPLPTVPQSSEPQMHLLHDGQSDSRYLVPVNDPRRLLNVYREQFAPHFPFIHIPESTSAEELSSQKPWLYRT